MFANNPNSFDAPHFPSFACAMQFLLENLGFVWCWSELLSSRPETVLFLVEPTPSFGLRGSELRRHLKRPSLSAKVLHLKPCTAFRKPLPIFHNWLIKPNSLLNVHTNKTRRGPNPIILVSLNTTLVPYCRWPWPPWCIVVHGIEDV